MGQAGDKERVSAEDTALREAMTERELRPPLQRELNTARMSACSLNTGSVLFFFFSRRKSEVQGRRRKE